MRLAACLLALASGAQASAQAIVTSPAPVSVGVTVYRSPSRGATERWDLSWLTGYALITERRTITIPAGDADIRFEGVAGGIIPESAIVGDLPDGVVEKNQDASLLSPSSLLGHYLGRRVQLKRTSRATGRTSEQEAIIRSGPGGAVVLQTPQGFEALRCTGLKETLVYPQVPQGLSAKPTLSVRTRSARAANATVTLSYLATGFDWRANYVATLTPDGRHIDLFAWVTLANGDPTSFRNASTNAVAGRLNTKGMHRREPPRAEPLRLRCWPQGNTTSDLRKRVVAYDIGNFPMSAPPPPPPPSPERGGDEIMVTGMRSMRAQQEELGDLKLYRIPEPVTIAARSQKQVAMLERDRVPVDLLYRARVSGSHIYQNRLVVKALNRKEANLGLPLPAGGFALFEEWDGRPLLVGEGSTEDKAVGEKVEVELDSPTNVTAQLVATKRDSGKRSEQRVLTVSNALPRRVSFEAELGPVDERLAARPAGRIVREDGKWVWRVTVPANSSQQLVYEAWRDN